ncbi:hypothetical protein ATE48_07545 [Candidatus Viadribacter manganicus]|uniref:Uncharacterized protein n=2 Tax=Candidatus Viadribacter manganicus TaxID=1759059 RepID=A0A1B1AGV7_9PROT|nr:hypothetical protein ATE48_07545 [Candidatus Viadribacter manganicus]
MRATLSPFIERLIPMPSTTDHWRLSAVAHTDRLIGLAMHQLDDANEARWVVHRVLLRAMDNMLAPISGFDLDAALSRVLRVHPVKAA